MKYNRIDIISLNLITFILTLAITFFLYILDVVSYLSKPFNYYRDFYFSFSILDFLFLYVLLFIVVLIIYVIKYLGGG